MSLIPILPALVEDMIVEGWNSLLSVFPDLLKARRLFEELLRVMHCCMFVLLLCNHGKLGYKQIHTSSLPCEIAHIFSQKFRKHYITKCFLPYFTSRQKKGNLSHAAVICQNSGESAGSGGSVSPAQYSSVYLSAAIIHHRRTRLLATLKWRLSV